MIGDTILATGVKYIFASCTPLYSSHFATVSVAAPVEWRMVATPSELETLLAQHNPIYIFFVHWNWKVPAEIFTRYECVCFHMTDVPYGRGGSPLQNLILLGHTDTVVTALRMVAELDAGPVYCKRPLSLAGRAEEVYLRAGFICAEIMQWIIANRPIPVAQAGDVIRFVRRNPDESVLPVVGALARLHDFIRMLDAPGYPLAFINYGEFRLEFSQAQLGDGELTARVVIRFNTNLETPT